MTRAPGGRRTTDAVGVTPPVGPAEPALPVPRRQGGEGIVGGAQVGSAGGVQPTGGASDTQDADGVDFARARRRRSKALRGGAMVCGVADAAAFDARAPAKHRPAICCPAPGPSSSSAARSRAQATGRPRSPCLMETMGTTERIQALGRARAAHRGRVRLLRALRPARHSERRNAVSFARCSPPSSPGSARRARRPGAEPRARVPLLERGRSRPRHSTSTDRETAGVPGARRAARCGSERAPRRVSRVSRLERRLSRRASSRTAGPCGPYDAARCKTRVTHTGSAGFQKVLEETLNEPDPRSGKMLLYGDFFTRTLWAITYSAHEHRAVLRVHARVPRRPRAREMQ